MRSALVLSAVLACSACPAHVMFDAPPPASAPEEMRTAYYSTHAPEPPERGEFVVRARMFEQKPTFTQKAVHLRNGVRVAYVEDLRTLVPEGSDVAKDIDASVAARQTADIVMGSGLAVAGVGAGAGGGLLASYLLDRGLNDQDQVDARLIGGLSALVVGVVVGGGITAWGTLIRDDEEDARTAAFRGLDAALQQKLALEQQPQPP